MLLRLVVEPTLAREYESLEGRLLGAMTPALDESLFTELAIEVFRFQQSWIPAFRSYFAGHSEIASWRDIPAVPQSAFKQAALSCVPLDCAQTVFLTSGTTGEARGRHYFLNTRLYDASIIKGWDLLVRPANRIFILAAPDSGSNQSSLGHMLGALGRQRSVKEPGWFIDAQGKLDAAELSRALQVATENNEPITLLGTALAFLNVFEALGNRQFRLPAGSFAMETGGYKGSGRDLAKADLYSLFTEYLGLEPTDIYNEYGMTELSSQFYTNGLRQVHRAPPWMKAMIIDPETGREVNSGGTGIIRIFDLANLNSAVAIETQDLAIRREDGFELLGRDPAALPRGCSRAADELLRR